MNLPNKLTLLRVILIPVFMIMYICNFGLGIWHYIIAAAIFVIASLTDMLDGKIARKYGLVTNLGKFLDPLADKCIVICALVCLSFMSAGYGAYGVVVTFASAIVIFRELAVTSMRLVAASADGSVIAAAILGKIKTTTQMIFITYAIVEPAIPLSICQSHIISYVLCAAMSVMTVWSGMDYLVKYWKYIKE